MKKLVIFLLLLGSCVSLAACALLGGGDPCAEGHSFTKWETTKKNNCGVAGEKTAVCDRCDATNMQEIPASGEHRLLDFVVETPATALTTGERVQRCQRCHLAVARAVIPALADSVAVTQSTSTKALALADFAVIYDSSVSNLFYTSAVQALHAELERFAGAELPLLPYVQSAAYQGARFLSGGGSFSPASSVLSRVQGHGFALAVKDDTVILAGTDLPEVIRAMQYFTYEYLLGKTGGQTITLHESAVASNLPQTVLCTESDTAFELVFSQRLDNDPAHKYVQSDTPTNSRDYPCVATEELASALSALTRLPASHFKVRDDKSFGEYELLIGTLPDRLESESFRLTLKADEYGILVQDGRIILTAHNDIVLAECIAQFLELLPLAERYEDGQTFWSFPEGFCAVARMENDWIMDFPQPTGEGITLYNTQYNNDDSLQFYYTGEGVSATAYRTYCEKLLAAGYSLLAENSIEDSIFKTFVNRDAGVTLYAAYNDFKHEEKYAVSDEYNVDYEKCIRVISAPLDSVTLPDEGLLTPEPTYEKITDSAITQLPFEGKAIGMGYVILLEDGRFVVVDGGGVNDGGREHEQLWDVLRTQFKRVYGKMPTVNDPVRIAAWINTHSHWDHYYAFSQMLKIHGTAGEVTMEYMIGNFPEKSTIYPVSSETSEMGGETAIPKLQSYVQGGFQYVKVHTGQKFYLANLTMEILMTYEDHNPRRICNSNDTCTVVRMSFENADAPQNAAPVTAIFLADAFRFQSRFLCAMYGAYLQSDIVQVAHHGNIGCEQPVYDAISPRVVLFPNAYKTYYIYTETQNGQWNYLVDRYVVKKLESVEYIYVAEKVCLTLTLGKDGPDHKGIYDAVSGELLAYNGKSIVKKTSSAE